MKLSIITLSCLLAWSASSTADPIVLPALSVDGIAGEEVPLALPAPIITSADAGELLSRLPGANANRNGVLTSVAQYRGLFGDRVNVVVDGMPIRPAGPNSMDTPLSYIPATRLDNLSLYRGIAPVSTGMETIGGTIMATSKSAGFGSGNVFEAHGNLNAGYNENGDAYHTSILASIANQNHRIQLAGSVERGDDMEFDGGKLLPTAHERDTFGAGYAYQNGKQSGALHIEHHDTGETGTPSLPMDIIWATGENYSGNFANEFANGGKLSMKGYHQEGEHRMSNNTLRTPNNPMMLRYADTDVKASGFGVSYAQSGWTVGADADQSDHNANIFASNNPMFLVNNYKDVERDRYSIFAEKQFKTGSWTLDAGARYTRVEMDAGKVASSMASAPTPMMMRMRVSALRDAFNNADRKQSDSLVDIVFNATKTLSPSLDLQLGVARKNRAASYQERYLWLPLESTAGLADGNNYMGNVGLNNETAYQLELGFDWHSPRAAFSPHIFYHRINDYIQGTPNMIAAANMLSNMMAPGKTVLQFNNVDAELYGFDANWFVALSDEWQLDGTVSYVQGKRRDTNDYLYRIAPLTARTRVSYHQSQWHVGLEAVMAANKSQVSQENKEKETSGYTLFNVNAAYQPHENVNIYASVNNVFDRGYENHLGGYNRIKDNPDVAQGARLPGLGRSISIGVNLDW